MATNESNTVFTLKPNGDMSEGKPDYDLISGGLWFGRIVWIGHRNTWQFKTEKAWYTPQELLSIYKLLVELNEKTK